MDRKKNEKACHVPCPDKIGSYFRLEKKTLALVTVSGILYNVGLGAGPWFEGQLAQYLYDIIGGSKAFADMLALALIYVAVTAFVQVMRYYKRLYVRKFANNVNRNMKHVLYFSLVHKSCAEMDRENTGSMMTKAVSDVNACAEGMRKFTTEVFDTGIAVTVYTVMLFVYDWRLALISCVFPPFAYFFAERMKKTVHKSTAAYKESAGRLNGATLDRVSGAVTYRVSGCDDRLERAYEERLTEYEKSAIAANIRVAAMQPIYQIISMMGAVLIIWLGARNVLGTGWANWNIAAFTTFLACFAKLAVKSSKAAKLFNSVQQAQVSWKRIKPLMHETSEDAFLPPAHPAALEVKDLSFSYADGDEILHDISFSAKPGQIIGVTGAVASGKSTLGRAFLCEYPYSGSIRFGDEELSKLPEEKLCAVVDYIGHDPQLMSDTIENNILLGDSGDVFKYLRAACLDEEVAAMPKAEKTPVGSGGVRLSGGQQARVAFARTLCHKKPVMILDDPFSAVDKETEKTLYENLRREAGDGIVLLITHRLGLFPQLDGVIWMENGKASSSTHDELMRTVPEYAHLYQTQTQGGDGVEA